MIFDYYQANMGTDVQLETLDNRHVEDLPTCRLGGFKIYQDIGIDTYQGMVYSLDTIYKLVKLYVENLDRDTILQMYLDDEFVYPKSVLHIYRILHRYKDDSDNYQVRFY
jgi:hypothetical protein